MDCTTVCCNSSKFCLVTCPSGASVKVLYHFAGHFACWIKKAEKRVFSQILYVINGSRFMMGEKIEGSLSPGHGTLLKLRPSLLDF